MKIIWPLLVGGWFFTTGIVLAIICVHEATKDVAGDAVSLATMLGSFVSIVAACPYLKEYFKSEE